MLSILIFTSRHVSRKTCGALLILRISCVYSYRDSPLKGLQAQSLLQRTNFSLCLFLPRVLLARYISILPLEKCIWVPGSHSLTRSFIKFHITPTRLHSKTADEERGFKTCHVPKNEVDSSQLCLEECLQLQLPL